MSLWRFDDDIRKEYNIICGVDEAGRGPLAGPVCCAAVILDPNDIIEGLNDSKKLTEKRREALYPEIKARALAWECVLVSERQIDEINILKATMQGMKACIEELKIVPDIALIDGNKCPDTDIKTQFVIKGDATSASIAAASIIAKVTRDHYMLELAKKYPQYFFEKHKGYGTKLHYEMIEKYGIEDCHRCSFLKKQGYWH